MTNPLTPAECLELDRQVAERREKMPTSYNEDIRLSPGGIWRLQCVDFCEYEWLPAHSPSTDIADAWPLVQEIQKTDWRERGEFAILLCKAMELDHDPYKQRNTAGVVAGLIEVLSPLTITRAWLAWDGAKKMEVEKI